MKKKFFSKILLRGTIGPFLRTLIILRTCQLSKIVNFIYVILRSKKSRPAMIPNEYSSCLSKNLPNLFFPKFHLFSYLVWFQFFCGFAKTPTKSAKKWSSKGIDVKISFSFKVNFSRVMIFYSPWNHKTTICFPMISEGKEVDLFKFT